MTDQSISLTLARLATQSQYDMLDERTVAMTKRCLLDAIGVSFAAIGLGEGCSIFRDYVLEQGGKPESTLFGSDVKVPAAMAALANGALAHAMDFEDAHDKAMIHPNAATVPAALAVCDATGETSGRRLITAVAIGCEVACRMALASGATITQGGWYPPPIYGCFGATAAAGYLLGLTDEQMVDAFSFALSHTCSAELKYSPHSSIRAVRDGFASKAGVLAADLARRGLSGFDRPLEGKHGFFALYNEGQFDPEFLLAKPGSTWEIARLSLKPWPSCRGTHAYIEMALALCAEHGLDAGDIAEIDIHGEPFLDMLIEPLEQKQAPATLIDAKFSVPFSVATAIVCGGLGLGDFNQENLHNAEILSLARRFRFYPESRSAGGGALPAWGEIRLRTHDGRELAASLDFPLGNPENPLPDEFLREKFADCLRQSGVPMDDAHIAGLGNAVLALETVTDLRSDLLILLGKPPDRGLH